MNINERMAWIGGKENNKAARRASAPFPWRPAMGTQKKKKEEEEHNTAQHSTHKMQRASTERREREREGPGHLSKQDGNRERRRRGFRRWRSLAKLRRREYEGRGREGEGRRERFLFREMAGVGGWAAVKIRLQSSKNLCQARKRKWMFIFMSIFLFRKYEYFLKMREYPTIAL